MVRDSVISSCKFDKNSCGFAPKRFFQCSLTIFLMLWISSFSVFAKDLNFEISIDSNKVALGENAQLNLDFNGIQSIPAFDLPLSDGLQARYVGPSTRMSIINGQVSSSVTHIYTLFPLKAGTYSLGPWKFDYKGDTYASNAITLEVVEGQVQKNSPNEPEGKSPLATISDRVFLVIQPDKNKAYLNEVVGLTIKLYVHKLGIRDIQFPTLPHEGFFTSEFQQPKQYQETLGGVTYEVLEFNASFFGLKTGELRLGPAALNCNVIVKKQSRRGGAMDADDFFNSGIFEDFFGGYQTQPLHLKSADIPITVMSLPVFASLENFNGAIGDFEFEASCSPQEVKVGDPITLRGVIKGNGNFNTVTIPAVPIADSFKVYEPQIKQEKGSKSFEQVIIPLDAKAREIPALSFNFFNPDTGKYQAITRGPFPIKVVKPEKQEEFKVVEPPHTAHPPLVKEEKLGRDIVYIKASLGRLYKKGEYLYKNKLFLLFQTIPFLCFIILYLFHVRKRRLATDSKYARALSAVRKARQGIRKAKDCLVRANKKGFYDCVFQTLQEYLGDTFHQPSKSITISIVDETLRHKSIPADILDKMRDIFRECDMARYAACGPESENTRGLLEKLEEVIGYFKKYKA